MHEQPPAPREFAVEEQVVSLFREWKRITKEPQPFTRDNMIRLRACARAISTIVERQFYPQQQRLTELVSLYRSLSEPNRNKLREMITNIDAQGHPAQGPTL